MTDHFPPRSLSEIMAHSMLSPEQQMPAAVMAADQVMHGIHTDTKTGLLTETGWRHQLQTRLVTLQPGESLAVITSDLDGFKEVNDTLGHTAGDELLAIVGQVFAEVYKRDTDAVARGSRETIKEDGAARLGGDEFATYIFFPAQQNKKRHSSIEVTVETQRGRLHAELTERLAGTKFERFGISLSTGEAFSEPGDTADSLFARADACMFERKYRDKLSQISLDDLRQLRDTLALLKRTRQRISPWLLAAVATLDEVPESDQSS